ncbi:MAG TPA: DUF2059 domain-containing protein [Pyrinomonadaceae bacterium]|nr:DUF2059 domain-containing protein [Pyrinomonadaceae bacterium]
MTFKKLAILTLIFVCAGIARAQEPVPRVVAMPTPSPTPEISAAKRALVEEILDLTNSREASESMFKAQFDEMQKQMPHIVMESISSMPEFKKLSAAQQDQVRAKINETSSRTTNRVKELFLQRVDMKKMIENISYTVYDKHFTEEELRDLVIFYKSPTGKKVVAEMPALFAESIAIAGDFIAPKVKEIVEETQKDQTTELTKQIESLIKTPPPPAKKTTRRRRP